jgi:DNA sulfur modification protein DndC
MENMVDGGDLWMEPLLEFRNFLKSTQDPELKPKYREPKGRQHGRVKEKNNGGDGIIPRAYKLEFRKHLLRKLLETEKEVNELRDDEAEYLELIRDEELKEIRRLWRTEEADWEDSVPKIYDSVMDDDLNWVHDDLGSFSTREAEVLTQVCEKHDVPDKLVKRLLDTELQHHGMKRRASIYNEIDKIFREDWRSIEEITADIEGEDPERWEYDVKYEEMMQ